METSISTPFAVIEERNSEAIILLKEFYPNCAEGIPQQRQKAQWQPENKLGFFMGIVQFGIDAHVEELLQLLQTNGFQEQQLFSMPLEPTFIDRMFDWYIMPFNKSYNCNSCHTPSKVSSRSNSRPSSVKEEDHDYHPISHKDLKEAVEKRDGVCLFCWDKLECEGAHIIAQKNILMAYDETSFLQRAGLAQQHLVQNGLLLCNKCHSQFDKLKRYVDVVEDKLVVKVVNETDDVRSEKHSEWKDYVRVLQGNRVLWQDKWTNSDRKAVETNGEMALYFIKTDPNLQPNRKALESHKTACLIWRMAGGAESDDEYCSDDEEYLGIVNTAALKRRFNIQDSSDTLNGINM
jgi:hypothetical protein